MGEYVLGIDVGTQGARVLVCDPRGAVAARADHPFDLEAVPGLPAGWAEQNPADWWQATTLCLRRAVQGLRDRGLSPEAIAGISLTSTSGTVCLADEQGRALGTALMYSDRRAGAEAEEANTAGSALIAKLGYRFSASFSLPKLLWLARHDPARFAAARYLLSPADYIVGCLTGEWGVSDYTNVLKTGYDLVAGAWPAFIEDALGLPRQRLPRVVAPGTPVGALSDAVAAATGLAAGTPVLAGMTDGCASQVSTGAVAPGQWNSTLGTTLVLKGVSRELLRDPLGRIYCHRHPDGHWLPGGASNTGGECLARHFAAEEFAQLDTQALQHSPTDVIIYPLEKPGERFPFVNPAAQGFRLGEPSSKAELFAAYLEGVGYVERLAYDTLESLGAELGPEVHVAGGATKSAPWVQIRADILGKTLLAPQDSGGAMGAAVIAAGGTLYRGIVPAARAMVRLAAEVRPRPELAAAYDDRYQRFRAACRARGYIA